MRKKWKYDRCHTQYCVVGLLLVFTGIATIFLISSCNKRDEHKHIPTNKTSDLDGLSQPTNQTVFSDVKTILPTTKTISPVIKATGIISYDPQLLNNISARFSGRIEKLYVRFNFENVSKGQRIMDIYSPEILTEQQNLIFLLKNASSDAALLNSSIQKLELLGFTTEQLKQIETTKKEINPLPIYSPYSGHIHDIGVSGGVASASTMNNGMGSSNASSVQSDQVEIENLPNSQTSSLTIKEGMYLQKGQAIFAVYSVDKVWAILNIFPQDAVFIKAGDKVFISAETNPSNVISSTISYIEPVAGQNASAIKARVYLQNADNLHLKIGTLLSSKIIPAEIRGLWLDRSAVVNLGQKQIVFLKVNNHFVSKIIQTGIITDSLVQIISGLKGDEVVAANAQFMVDSESFIKTSDYEQK